MKQDLEYTVFIDRFLKGEMSPDELNWFEKELAGNQALSSEVELHKKVDATLSDGEMIDLKNQLELIHQEIEEATEYSQSAIRHIYRKIRYSGAALAVAVLLFTLYIANRDFSSDKLVEKYYNPEIASLTLRGDLDGESMLVNAMDLYNKKQYSEAIALFETLLKEDDSKMGLNLYSGISHMEIKEFKAANERFTKIINNKPNPFVESATWYLGMCYIMTDDRERAAEQFEALAKHSKYYEKDAKRILRRIK